MIISDINLICIGQNRAVKYTGLNNGYITSHKRSGISDVIYKNKYATAQKANGIWYQVEPTARLAGEYDSEFFDVSVEGRKNKVIFIQDDFKQSIVSFVNTMLELSPIHMVCFFVDLQGEDNGRSCLNRYDFEKLVDENSLYFNTEYWINQ